MQTKQKYTSDQYQHTHTQRASLTLQNTHNQTTDHTKHCSPNRYRLHKIHPTPTPSRGNPSPPSYLPCGHKWHTHLHIHSKSTAPPTLHAKPNTNTEKKTSDTRTTLPHATPHPSPVPDNSSVRTHIHTEFTQRALDSLPPWCPAAPCLPGRAYAGLLATGTTPLWPIHSSPLIHAQAMTCSGRLLS